jgi:hypothetical protein
MARGSFPSSVLPPSPRGIRAPSIRASYLKSTMAALSLLDHAAAVAARARLSPRITLDIDRALSIDWLPVAHDLAVTEAVAAACGRAAVRRWGREGMLTALRGPLLKPILDGAVAIFGPSPRGLLRHARPMWTQIYRDCGELEVDLPRGNQAVLRFEHIPVELGNAAYAEGMAGALEATLAVASRAGEVTFAYPRPRQLTFCLSWSD